MGLNIVVGIVALLVALVLYSLATWGAYRAGALRPRDLRLLWIGLAFDVLATVMMALSIGGLDLTPSGTPHTVLALTAFGGMLAVAAFGSWALAGSRQTLQHSLSRVVVAPWLLWAGVFVWGMTVRAPHHG